MVLSARLGLTLAILARGSMAFADGPSTAASATPEVGTSEAIEAARAHFTKGRALYQAGSYREAIVELDAARALDPKAKDLVFNLGVVHEKLGDIDEALRYVRLYSQMDLEPAERARAESYITRLEGAKSEVLARKAAEARQAAAAAHGPEAANARVRGRLDVATVVVGVGALAAAATGGVFGIKAVVDKPTNFVTGKDGTLADLQHLESTAHTEAVVSDACFVGAVAGAVAATVLYFGRYRDVVPSASKPQGRWITVTPVLGPHAGALSLGGAF
jgi:tetratricopeptide (TPR) repeat protein